MLPVPPRVFLLLASPGVQVPGELDGKVERERVGAQHVKRRHMSPVSAAAAAAAAGVAALL